jgi:hypothetical protein
MLVPGEKRKVMAFTDADMARLLVEEQENGRIPSDIEIIVSGLPSDIHDGLYKKRDA